MGGSMVAQLAQWLDDWSNGWMIGPMVGHDSSVSRVKMIRLYHI